MSTRDTVVDVIRSIAPELTDDELTDDAHLQQDLDLDSMDFLDLVAGLRERTGITIPESDYGELHSISSCTAYLEWRGVKA